jgi:hypothetical protein
MTGHATLRTNSVARNWREGPTVDQDRADPQFDAMTARLLRREALRRAAEEMNTTSGPGLEGILARISAEVTAEARRPIAPAEATDHDDKPPVDDTPPIPPRKRQTL